MRTCKNCKYWDDGICDYVGWMETDSQVPDDDMGIDADAHDDSGMYVYLKTGPNFGCLKFNQRY